MALTQFPTWPVDGPLPLPPVHGLLPAAASPAAGVRFIVDTTIGPVDENAIAPDGAGLESGLYRKADGTIWLRYPPAVDPRGQVADQQVYTPQNAGRERWLSGIEVYPYPPDVPESWDACAHGTEEKSFGTAIAPPDFAALTLSLPISCSSRQVPDEDAFKARAVTVMVAVESWGVEAELIGGPTIGSNFLANGSGEFPNGDSATRPNHGLQVLEEQIALSGRQGLIHCTPMLATALLGQGFVIQDTSGVIRTINGIVVIPGFGYAGAPAPTGHAAPTATEEWAYATGPVDVRRSEVFTTPDTRAEALDRGNAAAATDGRPNTFTYRAERYYAVDWDTAVHAAVLIDRCGSTCVVGT